jgi:hypothetical protein
MQSSKDHATTSQSSERLPASLYMIYQTYKRGTNIVTNWLSLFDQNAPGRTKNVTKQPDATPDAVRLTVKEILERARLASEQAVIPPKKVESAFKVTMVNRNKVTAHYESLTTNGTSVHTIQSNNRHKVFNDTLAKAYTLLFPVTKKVRRALRQAGQEPDDGAASVSVNHSIFSVTSLRRNPFLKARRPTFGTRTLQPLLHTVQLSQKTRSKQQSRFIRTFWSYRDAFLLSKLSGRQLRRMKYLLLLLHGQPI